jgi:hypothetical protein
MFFHVEIFHNSSFCPQILFYGKWQGHGVTHPLFFIYFLKICKVAEVVIIHKMIKANLATKWEG